MSHPCRILAILFLTTMVVGQVQAQSIESVPHDLRQYLCVFDDTGNVQIAEAAIEVLDNQYRATWSLNGELVTALSSYGLGSFLSLMSPPVAAASHWYLMNDPIPHNGRQYSKSGLPVAIYADDWNDDLIRVGVHNGVALFARSAASASDSIYVPVVGGPFCEFQIYAHQR